MDRRVKFCVPKFCHTLTPLLIMYLEERINHDMSVMGELSFRLIAFKERFPPFVCVSHYEIAAIETN